MEAAIITPAANPKKIRWIDALISFLKKNTVAEPMLVIKNVNPVPAIAHKIACVISYSLLLKVSLS